MKEQREGMVEWIERLRMAAMKAVSEDDMREIFKGLTDRAKKGDREAIRLLMTYLQVPSPVQPPALPQRPAQQIKANVVNVYPGRRSKKPKLLNDVPFVIDRQNGATP